MKEGDRVCLPSGKVGEILPPAWLMPHHHLVQFDDGTLRWCLRELVRPVAAVAPGNRRRKTA
ncbi:MAG: hypothetical protein MUF49_28460 [Oculatellaceae cyanobacterium Prado106]|nr:hypothetical protein [Oculatellaceae cyanobacterium Prado106]